LMVLALINSRSSAATDETWGTRVIIV
jgi:hypothetical protein